MPGRRLAPAKSSKWWLWLLCLCIGAVAIWYFYFRDEKPVPNMGGSVAPVRVAVAISQNVPHFLNGLGTVIPSGDVLVQSRVAGQLEKLHFTEGQTVKAGELLAEIDPRPFQAALDKAKGNLEKDQAQLQNAKGDLARYAKLARGDFIAEQQYENQKSLVRQWEGAVEADRAEVASAALQLEYSRITAPIGGRLGLRNVDEGNQVAANDPAGIVRITETTPCDVIFTLPESQVGLVARALHAREQDKTVPPLLAQAWNREDTQLLASGELISLDNQIDQGTGTVRLKARFPNKDHALYPRQFVNVRLLVQTLKDVVTIPAAAVQLGAKGSYCYIIVRPEDSHQPRAEYREVTPGIVDAGVQVIESGLAPGDMVAVDGLDRLRDGTPVRIAATMETPALAEDTP